MKNDISIKNAIIDVKVEKALADDKNVDDISKYTNTFSNALDDSSKEKKKIEGREYSNTIDKVLIKQLRTERKYDEVYDIIKKAYDITPNNDYVALQFMNATIDYLPYNSEEIRKLAEQVVKTKHVNAGNYGYVIYYLSIGDVNKAYEHYKLLNNDDYYLDLVISKLTLYKCQVDFKPLIFDFERYDKKFHERPISNSKYAFYSSELADYYFNEKKDFVKAIEYFKYSIEKKKEKHCIYAYARLADCYHINGNYKESRKCYKLAVDLAKKYNTVGYLKNVHEYASALVIYGDYEEALAQADILDKGETRDKNMATSIRGKVYVRQKKYDDAIAEFNKLLDESKLDRKTGLVDLIKVYRYTADFENATKYINMLYKEYPSIDPIVKFAYYYDFKMYNECIDYCKKFLDSEYQKEAKYFIAKSYSRLSRYEEAEKIFKSLSAAKNIAIYFELGYIYEKMGDYEQAYDNYQKLIIISRNRNDKTLLNKGLIFMVGLLCNRYKFDLAEEFIEEFKEAFPLETEKLDDLYAVLYYRKQDYQQSIDYFNKLIDTKYSDEAKNYLTVIYRLIGESERSTPLLKELENTEYKNHTVLNRALLLKDQHTCESLIEAYMKLYSIKDTVIKNMVIVELIQILLRFGKYNKAQELLEEAYECYAFTENEYYKYRSYILFKLGNADLLKPEDKSLFLNLCINYNPYYAISDTINLNNKNSKGDYNFDLGEEESDASRFINAFSSKSLYFTREDFENLYYDLSGTIGSYNYYLDGLYDVYIIDMGKVVGNYFGLSTQYISVKCEQGTHNIHLIEPTLKKINLNKYKGKVRIRTDLEQD